VDYHERLLRMILDGTIKDRKTLQVTKIALSRAYGLGRVPSNSETLAKADPETLPVVEPLLRRKPVRTLSGVAVVAVMTSPAPCPHGKCSYCPGGVETGSPQSYTGKEPAARRALANDFDPFRQVRSRLRQLESIGHPTDKVDLIIMGGTFTSRPVEYQMSFVQRCFDALNGAESGSISEAHLKNETSAHRCIGMTVETRPDVFDDLKDAFSMELGATRVELGVQILDDEILKGVNRGHGVDAVAEATRIAKEKGLKVCYHVMPGLPGSSPQKDVECFARMFDDERFRPDMIKIYPTLVVKGTPLYDMWRNGTYSPYSTEEAVKVIAEMKRIVPAYVRIQRIQRDIPVPLIEAGVDKGHIRQLVKESMRSQGYSCNCIRCREVGLMGVEAYERDDVRLNLMSYQASGGIENFISFEIPEIGALVGYARLRLNISSLEGGPAHLRELKVFGQMVPIGDSGEGWQHRGFGKELMAEAERIAREAGSGELLVTSGVGARQYYASLGYVRSWVYMVKSLR
jgi:elongator complex protein 3